MQRHPSHEINPCIPAENIQDPQFFFEIDKHQFVTETDLSDACVCSICFNLIRGPLSIQTRTKRDTSGLLFGHCAHTFCAGCIKSWEREAFYEGKTSKCPVCRIPFQSKDLVPDLRLQQIIANQLLKCIYYAKGCTWQGFVKNSLVLQKHELFNLSEKGCMYPKDPSVFKNHIDYDCPFQPILCPFDKQHPVLPRKDQHEHMKTCDSRHVPCTLCNLPISLTRMDEHAASECLLASISCPNKCFGFNYLPAPQRTTRQKNANNKRTKTIPPSYHLVPSTYSFVAESKTASDSDRTNILISETMPRKDLTSHLEVCPLAIINCPYQRFGCIVPGPLYRCDLRQHEITHLEQHKTFLLKYSSNISLPITPCPFITHPDDFYQRPKWKYELGELSLIDFQGSNGEWHLIEVSQCLYFNGDFLLTGGDFLLTGRTLGQMTTFEIRLPRDEPFIARPLTESLRLC